MLIEPTVYVTKFTRGLEAGSLQRFVVTREFRGYRLWYISFCVLEPRLVERLSLFDSKLTAILAARLGDPSRVWAFVFLLSRNRVPPILDHDDLKVSVPIIAVADGLDRFVRLECCWPGFVEYETKHGVRYLDVYDPTKRQFQVMRSADNFAVAVPLPYIVVPPVGSNDSHLLVPDVDKYQPGTLIVHVIPWLHQEARVAGYDNAISTNYTLPEEIEDLEMLDTDYAALLAQQEAGGKDFCN